MAAYLETITVNNYDYQVYKLDLRRSKVYFWDVSASADGVCDCTFSGSWSTIQTEVAAAIEAAQ